MLRTYPVAHFGCLWCSDTPAPVELAVENLLPRAKVQPAVSDGDDDRGGTDGGGQADGIVVGSMCPTADTVRSAIFGVGLKSGNKTVSACSVMCTQVKDIGVGGAVIFADTGVLIASTVEQLADIAIAAADSCRAAAQAVGQGHGKPPAQVLAEMFQPDEYFQHAVAVAPGELLAPDRQPAGR